MISQHFGPKRKRDQTCNGDPARRLVTTGIKKNEKKRETPLYPEEKGKLKRPQ